MEKFTSSAIVGFTLLITNELGDRTFFLTALFCSENALLKVFLASFTALILNSTVSILFGRFILPLFLATKTIEIVSSFLLFLFGIWIIWKSLRALLKERSSNETDDPEAVNTNLPASFSRIFLVIFLAEFGDRSQLATFALSASHNVGGIVLGTFLGHFICAMIACLAGSIASKTIPTHLRKLN